MIYFTYNNLKIIECDWNRWMACTRCHVQESDDHCIDINELWFHSLLNRVNDGIVVVVIYNALGSFIALLILKYLWLRILRHYDFTWDICIIF